MTDVVHLAAFDDSGRVITVVSGPAETVEGTLLLNTDLPYLVCPELPSTHDHYVEGEELLLRPKGTATIQGNTLFGVPSGAEVEIEGTVYAANGENIELEFSLPGNFIIKVRAWPAMEQVIYYENPAQM